jgi:hypothetical protein
MVIRVLKKVVEGSQRKKTLKQKTELRKKILEQRNLEKKKENIKKIVLNGKRAVALIQNKGLERFSLPKLKIIEKTLNLEVTSFHKEFTIQFGGHWGKAHDILMSVRKRIKELENKKK